jgi:hypothetical protein
VVEGLTGWRVVADPASLDEISGTVPVSSPSGGRAGEAGRGVLLRFAPDDALVLGEKEVAVSDPHAIVERDTGWAALQMTEERALDLIAAHASWQASLDRPVLLQGMVAGLPVKVYLDGEQSMIIIAAPFGHELEDRLGS